jgi:hypothetical protein
MLILKIAVVMDSPSTWRLFDITGDYSGTNLTGWGTPNPARVTGTQWTLTITSETYSTPIVKDLTAFEAVATYDLSEMNEVDGLTITATDLLALTNFPDGLYTIRLSWVVGGVTYEAICYYGIFTGVTCCVQRRVLNQVLPVTDKKAVLENTLSFMMLQGLAWGSCCGNSAAYNNILEYLEEKCNECGTSTVNQSFNSPCGC